MGIRGSWESRGFGNLGVLGFANYAYRQEGPHGSVTGSWGSWESAFRAGIRIAGSWGSWADLKGNPFTYTPVVPGGSFGSVASFMTRSVSGNVSGILTSPESECIVNCLVFLSFAYVRKFKYRQTCEEGSVAGVLWPFEHCAAVSVTGLSCIGPALSMACWTSSCM